MARRMSRAARKEAVLIAAAEMADQMEAWYDQHPEATFAQIEQRMGELRRELMGQVMAIVINGRDTGLQPEAPRCERCQQPLRHKGYAPWTVKSLEGAVELERSYYVCASEDCRSSLFPPRSQTGAAP